MDNSMIPLAMILWFLSILLALTFQNNINPESNKPSIDPLEKKALYNVLNSINPNPTIPWTTRFPGDICVSPPRFLVCTSHQTTSHISELYFGYFSDQTYLLPCSPNATLDANLFTPFTHLRKLGFSKCFNHTHKPILHPFPPSLQQLVFLNNPAIVSPLEPFLHNLTSLKKLVLIGNAFHGQLPLHLGAFHNLLWLTFSENNLSGEIPASIGMLNKLKLLDLSNNDFTGCVPQQLGNLVSLFQLNLSHNGFACKIPDSFVQLKNLVFLDLSFNHFGSFGVPLFLGELTKLKELYLSGNKLSGEIPEIWEKLGAVKRIGFSQMGLVGQIPASMGLYLDNLCYLALDNNNLEGPIPDIFWYLLPYFEEINLENNNLRGKMKVSCGGVVVLKKMKLAGNIGFHLNVTNEGCSSCPNAAPSNRTAEF